MQPLSSALKRELRGKAQLLDATLRVGKDGLSPQFITALDEALKHKPLLKVRFDYFKEEKKELAPRLAELTSSHFITRVGHVVVLYRPKPEPASASETPA